MLFFSPEKEALLPDLRPVLPECHEDAQRDGEQRQLDVPHPHGDVRALQDLLEVDAGQPGQDAGSDGGRKAGGLGLLLKRLFQ